MMERFRPHYLKFNPRRFVTGTVVILVLLDILSGLNFKQLWHGTGMAQNVTALTIQRMQLNPQDLSQETVMEIEGLINKSFDLMLAVILLNNLFFYFFYLRKKLWAQSYVLFYTLTAGFFSILMLTDMRSGIGWMIYNFLTIPIYIYLYLGIKVLKPETVEIKEKKAQ